MTPTSAGQTDADAAEWIDRTATVRGSVAMRSGQVAPAPKPADAVLVSAEPFSVGVSRRA